MKLALTTAPLLGFGFTTLACATVYNDDFVLDEPGLGGSLIGAGATTGTAADGPGASGGVGSSGPLPTGGSGTGGAPAGSGGTGSASGAGGTSAGGASGGSGTGGASSGGAGSGGAASGGTTGGGDCAEPTLGSRASAACGDTWVFQGALYECLSQAANVNGEPTGCGTAGVYCSAIDPNHVAFGALAWAKVADCP